MEGANLGLTFARLVDIPLDRARSAAPDGRAWLRRGRWRRPLEMELRLSRWWPRSGATTLIELVPTRNVAPTSGYFNAGNRLLDQLVQAMPVESRRRGQARPAAA